MAIFIFNSLSCTITLMQPEDERQKNHGQDSWQFSAEATETSPQVITSQTEPATPAPEVMPAATAIPPAGPDGSISWTASEFIAHSKSASWYVLLMGVAAVAAAIVWLLTKDTVSAAVVVVGAALLAVYGARQPRQLEYRLDQQALSIGTRTYNYHQFRSFSIVPEGAFNSIVFMPLKRFAPLITIYYAPEDEDKIVSLLADRLPMEERKKDAIDRLMWRIRF
jgi:hypothetical protein